MKRDIKLFIDFDGTITKEDVGDAIFRRFTDTEKVNKVIRDLLADKISARECWDQLCALVDRITLDEVNRFIDTIEIDPSFHELVKYCTAHSIDFIILSDGFDLYIDRILKRENLQNLRYFSNSLTITNEGKLVPFYPYYDRSCRFSASCKRNHILNNSGDNEVTVFIGDGNSDKDTIQYCDYIFAKDGLLKYCEKERITFFPYKNFHDVITRLDMMTRKRNLKKRVQAELKRKEAYKIE